MVNTKTSTSVISELKKEINQSTDERKLKEDYIKELNKIEKEGAITFNSRDKLMQHLQSL